jgi:esterase/lipase superfamily enzyme
MGNYVLGSALHRILEFSGPRPLPRFLDSVFMCSPDVNDDVFDNHGDKVGPMLPLLDLARGVSIYYNRGDKALFLSDTTKGNANRLGSDGVAHPQSLHGRIHQIDCSGPISGVAEHSYYMLGRVADDIRQTLDDRGHGSASRSRRQGSFENSWILI